MEEHNTDSEENETKKAREWEMNKEKGSLVQECVRKRDGGNIYICPLMGV